MYINLQISLFLCSSFLLAFQTTCLECLSPGLKYISLLMVELIGIHIKRIKTIVTRKRKGAWILDNAFFPIPPMLEEQFLRFVFFQNLRDWPWDSRTAGWIGRQLSFASCCSCGQSSGQRVYFCSSEKDPSLTVQLKNVLDESVQIHWSSDVSFWVMLLFCRTVHMQLLFLVFLSLFLKKGKAKV